MDWNLIYTKRTGYQYPGKKIVDPSKLKLWTFLRGQGECWIIIIILYIELSV